MPLPEVTQNLLTVYMTEAGFDAALTEFGEPAIAAVVAQRGENLMLAAADLLDGLAPVSTGAGGLTSFKLDVLEFKYAPGSTGTTWATLAAGLRERAASSSVSSLGDFGPLIEPWGIG